MGWYAEGFLEVVGFGGRGGQGGWGERKKN